MLWWQNTANHRTIALVLQRRKLLSICANSIASDQMAAMLIFTNPSPGIRLRFLSSAIVATFLFLASGTLSLIFSAWSALCFCFWHVCLSRALPGLLSPLSLVLVILHKPYCNCCSTQHAPVFYLVLAGT